MAKKSEPEISLDLLECDAGWAVKYRDPFTRTNMFRLFKTQAEAEARLEEWRTLLASVLTRRHSAASSKRKQRSKPSYPFFLAPPECIGPLGGKEMK